MQCCTVTEALATIVYLLGSVAYLVVDAVSASTYFYSAILTQTHWNVLFTSLAAAFVVDALLFWLQWYSDSTPTSSRQRRRIDDA